MIIDEDKSQKLITLAFNAGQEIIKIYNKKVFWDNKIVKNVYGKPIEFN